jgi:hypothetical protein
MAIVDDIDHEGQRNRCLAWFTAGFGTRWCGTRHGTRRQPN